MSKSLIFAAGLTRLMANAATWLLILGGLGAAFLVAGAYVLAGLGWALLAASSACLVSTVVLLRGLAR